MVSWFILIKLTGTDGFLEHSTHFGEFREIFFSLRSCEIRNAYIHLLKLEFSTLGNKTDRDDREIPTAIGEEFAKQQGMYFLETSAKEADNVERLFYEIAAELIEQARTKEVNNLKNI